MSVAVALGSVAVISGTGTLVTEESSAWSLACSADWRWAPSPISFRFSLPFADWVHGPNMLLCTALFTPTGKGLAFILEINRTLSHGVKDKGEEITKMHKTHKLYR